MLMTRLILSFSLLWSFAQTNDLSERLLEAARAGDVEQINTLLGQGADVNASTRYGATALHYASDKGHFEAVKLLLSRGAQVNVNDNFYGETPLTWSLSNGHLGIAKLLIEAGARGAGQALTAAVRSSNQALFAASLASPHLEEAAKSAALQVAKQADAQAFVDLLVRAGASDEIVQVEVPLREEELGRFPGKYRNEDSGTVIEVTREGSQLLVQWPGQPRTSLKSYGDGNTVLQDDSARLRFFGRGGIVEQLVVAAQGRNRPFFPVTDAELAELARLESRARERASDHSENADSSADMNRSWGSFRGHQAAGSSDGQDLPESWNVKTGENIRWKTPVPGIATSSPVVWENRVFVTTAHGETADTTFRTGLYGDVAPVEDLSEHSWKLYSLDLATGRILWEKLVHKGIPSVKRHPKSSQANSSPTTDGRNVVVLFGSIGILANFDFDGKLVWKKDLGVLNSGWFYNADYEWGHSSSPVIYGESVIVQSDVQGQSFLAAYRLSDGEEIWRHERDEISTWGTPTVYEGPTGSEVVTNGTTIRSYDPANGKLLWWLAPNSEVTVGTPILHDNLIIVTAGYPPVRPIYAVRVGSRGDLSLPEGKESSSSIAWSRSRGGTYIPTPIVYRGYLYMNANNGRLTCYDAVTGEQIYRA